MDAFEYCNDCCDNVEVTDQGERKCSFCNPQWLDEEDLQPLNFDDNEH